MLSCGLLTGICAVPCSGSSRRNPAEPRVYFAIGDCGPLPNIRHAEPPEDAKHRESFSISSKVTYRCVTGYTKRPLMSDIIQCLENSQWSNLPEFCGRKYCTFSETSCSEKHTACGNACCFSNRCFKGFLIRSDARWSCQSQNLLLSRLPNPAQSVGAMCWRLCVGRDGSVGRGSRGKGGRTTVAERRHSR